MKKEMRLTPAAIAALAANDVDNFIVAATEGGIEQQEAEGQQALCANSARLPKEGDNHKEIDRALYEKMGIVFGDDANDLFVNVTLPEGWKITPTDHSMWNRLEDDKGRQRAAIFYKAAFYDERASISLRTRFSIQKTYCNAEGESAYHGNQPPKFEPTHETYQVKDADTVVFVVPPIPMFKGRRDEERESRIRRFNEHERQESLQYAQCGMWLVECYPDWRDPFAYWD